ncbi:MAG TPA: hypothetical protein VLJ86_03810 [Ramlibacter sp.]|nr:hypothetical protein [Ramlibacter sp.]
MMRAAITLLLAGLWGLCAPASAQIERLDDSASPRAQVHAVVEDSGVARPGTPDSPVVRVSFGRIQYRLATARHVGRRARIYYVIPAGIPGLRTPSALQVTWRSEGLFASSQGRPGERIPVWNGIVRDAWMNESFDIGWQLDLRELRLPRGAQLGFEAYFDIETLP